jgi:hypothetical protein
MVDVGYPYHIRVQFYEQTVIKGQMMKHQIDFTGHRDQSGYQLVYPKTKQPLRSHKRGWTGALEKQTADIQPIRIVGKGGKPELIRPLDQNPTLFKAFSEIKIEDDVLDFVNRFGSLGTEIVDEIIVEAERMSQLQKANKTTRRMTVRADFKLINPTVYLSIDKVKRSSSLRIVPSTLLDALLLQLASSVSSGAKLRKCLQCEDWFEVGPGTGRRLDAKFCSDEHRTEYHNYNRSRP